MAEHTVAEQTATNETVAYKPVPERLDGMVAVVTGTAQGIGRAIAAEIRAAGATVHRA